MSLDLQGALQVLTGTTLDMQGAAQVLADALAGAEGGGGPLVIDVPPTAPADSSLAANQMSFWSNDGSNLLAFKMKNSAGVVKTGTIALT